MSCNTATVVYTGHTGIYAANGKQVQIDKPNYPADLLEYNRSCCNILLAASWELLKSALV